MPCAAAAEAAAKPEAAERGSRLKPQPEPKQAPALGRLSRVSAGVQEVTTGGATYSGGAQPLGWSYQLLWLPASHRLARPDPGPTKPDACTRRRLAEGSAVR